QPKKLTKKGAQLDYNKLERDLLQKLDKNNVKRLEDLRLSLENKDKKYYSEILNEIKGLSESYDEQNTFNQYVEERLNLLSDAYKSITGQSLEAKTDSSQLTLEKDFRDVTEEEKDSTKEVSLLEHIHSPHKHGKINKQLDSIYAALKDSLAKIGEDTSEVYITSKDSSGREVVWLSDTSGRPVAIQKKVRTKIGKPWINDLLDFFSRDTVKFKRKTGLEVATGYDFDNYYTIEARYGSNFRYGPVIGFSPKQTRNVTTPVINNFYGEGNSAIKKLFVGASIGTDLGKYVTFNAALGLNVEDEEVVESIKRSNGQVLSTNKDSYSNKKMRGYFGLDANLGKFSLGPRFVYDANKFYAGLMARYRF
ncbi:MAG: hypothetical protein AABW45_00275, partial [Nanoarchaeota archaeon]